jgi:hypothetical protein
MAVKKKGRGFYPRGIGKIYSTVKVKLILGTGHVGPEWE